MQARSCCHASSTPTLGTPQQSIRLTRSIRRVYGDFVSLTGEQQNQTGRGQRSRADDQWVRVRYALIVGWLLVIVATVMLGERSASWDDIQGQVTSGEVRTVRVSGALPADATGYATVDVHWRHGLWRYIAQVVEVHGPGAPSTETLLEGTGVSAVVHTDPGVRLSRSHPGLRVLRESQHGSDSSLLGWRVPNWLGLVAFALILGGLAVLVAGPQPWRATRWAWFWLALPPVGSIAFVLFSGPTPLLPTPRDPTRRLSGGWAFLLAITLLAMLNA